MLMQVKSHLHVNGSSDETPRHHFLAADILDQHLIICTMTRWRRRVTGRDGWTHGLGGLTSLVSKAGSERIIFREVERGAETAEVL